MKKTLLQFAAALFSAALIVSLWPPVGQTGNVWFALVPLLLLVRHVSVRRAFWLGGLVGFASWVGQLWWMLALTDNDGPWYLVFPALLGLSAVLAVFIAVFAGLAAALRTRFSAAPGLGRMALAVVLEPALWAGLECLRSNIFTGFAWNPLGLALATPAWLPIAQVAALGGAALASALVVSVNGAIATLCERLWFSVTHTGPDDFRGRALLSAESILPLAVLLVAFLWGTHRIAAYNALIKEAPRASVVAEATETPSVFSGGRVSPLWRRETLERARTIAYVRPDLWLWPESAVFEYAFPDAVGAKAALAGLASEADTTLLLGGLHRAPEEGWYNAALLFTAQGLDQVYGKRHLVPFGEYIPFDKTFPWLQRFAPTGISNVPGRDVTVLTLPSGLVVGPLICFEDTVASVVRESVNDGAKLLLNMSNDAWYAGSAEPDQHALQAALRCIESGVPMARSSNGGRNVAYDAVGRVVENLAGLYPDAASGVVPLYLPVTERPFAGPYLRYGELVFGAPCAAFVLGLLAWLFLRARRRPTLPRAPLAVLLLLLAVAPARAQSAGDSLLPAAGMALDDGNLNIAERTARDLLNKLGLTPEERARAIEILIRADLAKGDWDAALKRIDECPELPAERRLVFTLAAHNGRQDFAATQRLFEAARPSADTEWGVAALRQALRADLELGRTLQASARFSAVNAAKGADSRTRAENALAWVARFPNAQSRAALLAAAEEADKGDVWLDCALALPQAYAGAEDRAEALALIDRLLDSPGLSSSVEARLALAAAELAATPDQAIAYARKAADVARRLDLRRRALSTLGTLLCSQPDADAVKEGLDALDQAVRLDPSAEDAPSLLLYIAETLAEQGHHEEALAAYDRWISGYDVPDLRIRVRRGRGRTLLAANRPDEALASFTEAIELADTATLRRELQVEAVEAALAAKRYARAETLCQELLKVSPDAAISLRLARALEAGGDYEAARRAYATTRDDPQASEDDAFTAAVRLAALFSKEGRYDAAIAELTRFLPRARKPAHQAAIRLGRGRAYHALALANGDRFQLERARDDFAAIEGAEDPAVAAEARFFLVLCHYGLGEDDQARTLAQTYLTDYPDSPRVPDMILWLAKSDFNRGEYEAAAKGFQTFSERWPNDPRVPNARFLAARAAYQAGDYAHAIELVATLAETAPQAEILPDARFLQAEALIELARFGEAAELLTRLIRHSPDAPWVGEAHGRLGDCLRITATNDPARYELAYKNYRAALDRIDPAQDADSAAMYAYQIGRVYEKQERLDLAVKQYYTLLYAAAARTAEAYTAEGRRWLDKARTRLESIETARGRRAEYGRLHARLSAAGLA